jgi:ubiquinone/menaquinone biosynthesis C-methylase UbiE
MRGIEQIPWLYDLGMHFMPRIARWRRDLAALAQGDVLEVGCGTGQMLPLYPEATGVVAFDPNRASLDRARRRCPDAGLLVADAQRMPFADGSFDTVVSGLVFCSVPDAARGLAEIKRVLRPGGQLLMLEHVHAGGRFGRRLLDALQPAWTRFTGGCHPNRDTESAVRQAGFRIESEHYRARGLMRRFVARTT